MNIMLIIWKNRGNMNNFGEIIKDIRKKNNLTQKELADKLYVTYQAVSKWENNKSIPDISILQNISKMFNIDLNYILYFNNYFLNFIFNNNNFNN